MVITRNAIVASAIGCPLRNLKEKSGRKSFNAPLVYRIGPRSSKAVRLVQLQQGVPI